MHASKNSMWREILKNFEFLDESKQGPAEKNTADKKNKQTSLDWEQGPSIMKTKHPCVHDPSTHPHVTIPGLA